MNRKILLTIATIALFEQYVNAQVNKSPRDGKESVLLYVSDLYASIDPDTKRLKAYTKNELKAGETKNVTL